MNRNNIYKFIFAGGGTGGHLFPAVAVAEQIRLLKPEADILFVGTKEKIEARVVPKLGFKFKTIWISGFSRQFNLRNLIFPIKLIVSMFQSLIINIKFNPKVTVGSGAYVSGPVAWGSSIMGAKIVLMEQNSYPGVTNRLLEKKAEQIYLCFEDSKQYFRKQDKLRVIGNPIRTELKLKQKNEAVKVFDLNPGKKTLLVLGGSLGAASLNNVLGNKLNELTKAGLQIIWQTGEIYFDVYKKFNSEHVKVLSFIEDMSDAYSAADLVVARAGATTIAEVSTLGLPVIFVPSKNVAANHQLMNAKSLINEDAAVLIRDDDLQEKLVDTVIGLIKNTYRLEELSKNIKKLSRPNAAKEIAEEVIKLAELN